MGTHIEELVTFGAGTLGCDWSFARPTNADLSMLYAKGKRFGVRYLSEPPSNPAKNLMSAERDQLHVAGWAIGLVWETSATRPLAGHDAGFHDGTVAAAMAKALGAPRGLPIMIAADFNVTTQQQAIAVRSYGLGFSLAVERNGFHLGVYGDLDAIIALADLSALNWLMVSTSFSPAGARNHPLVHVAQLGHGIEPSWYDPNIVKRDTVFWLPHEVADPVVESDPPPVVVVTTTPSTPPIYTPDPEEQQDMQYVLDSDTIGSALVTPVTNNADGSPAHKMVGFNSAAQRLAWALVVPVKHATDADYQAIAAAKIGG